MNEAPELAGRYARGEDVSPLLRSVGAGVIGALVALAIDWVIPSPPLGAPVWPTLVSAVVTGDPSNVVSGVTIIILLAVSAAVVFTYGQFRRFVPGPPMAAGAAWAIGLWLVVAPVLLPRAATWLSVAADTGSPTAAISRTAVIAVELTAGMLAYGAVVGWLNPRRQHPVGDEG